MFFVYDRCPTKHTCRCRLSHRQGLTAGEVWGVVGVGQEQVVGLGHPEVHHLGCVLESPNCILVHHILQTHAVHLIGHNKQGNTIRS